MKPEQGACINCFWRHENPSLGEDGIFTVAYDCLNAKNPEQKFTWPCKYWSKDKKKE